MSRSRDFREPRRRNTNDEDFAPQWRGFDEKRPSDNSSFAPNAAPSGPPVDAKVKWFNSEKGFGFVEMTDGSGDAFCHVRSVEKAGYDNLMPGTKLSVRLGQGQKGLQVMEILEVDTSTAEAAPAGGGFGGGSRPPRPQGGGYGGGAPSGAARAAPSGPSERTTGVVKWYNSEKGFGFIALNDGRKDVFVHRSVLARAGLSSLDEGQKVNVDIAEGQKGPEVVAIADDDY